MPWLIGGGVALFALGLIAAHIYTRAARPSYSADAARLARERDRRGRSDAAKDLAAAEAAAVVRVSADVDDVDSAIDFMRELGGTDTGSED